MYIELIDYMGSDKLHGLAAWASTFADFGIEMPKNIEPRVDILVEYIINNGKKKRSLEDLITYLADNEHNSPFRFSSFVFTSSVDISCHIQKLKHRVLVEAENSASARYKELEDNFYLPEDWKNVLITDAHIIKEHGVETWYELLEKVSKYNNYLYHNAVNDLKPVLGKKRTKETARYFKMYNSEIQSLTKFSFDGVIQFHKKRGDSNIAQNEIAFMANEMINCIKNIEGNPFKYSLKAFGYGN